MGKRDDYKNFNDFKNQNYNELFNEYKSNNKCGDSMISTYDCSFDEYCLSIWQRI